MLAHWNFMVHSFLGEEVYILSPRIVVLKEGESPPSIDRNCPSPNDDSFLRGTLNTFGGVGELYRRRSPLIISHRCAG